MSMSEPKPINSPMTDDNDLYGGSSVFNSDLTEFKPNQAVPLKRNRLLLTKKIMRKLLKQQSK